MMSQSNYSRRGRKSAGDRAVEQRALKAERLERERIAAWEDLIRADARTQPRRETAASLVLKEDIRAQERVIGDARCAIARGRTQLLAIALQQLKRDRDSVEAEGTPECPHPDNVFENCIFACDDNHDDDEDGNYDLFESCLFCGGPREELEDK